jgi:hypothetical protein
MIEELRLDLGHGAAGFLSVLGRRRCSRRKLTPAGGNGATGEEAEHQCDAEPDPSRRNAVFSHGAGNPFTLRAQALAAATGAADGESYPKKTFVA